MNGMAMTADDEKTRRSRNLRTALIFASIALAGFAGVILRSWLMMQ
jgi:hypothetical protein